MDGIIRTQKSDSDFQRLMFNTQKNLQQFSSLITAMVIDAKTGDVGYFRVDEETGESHRIPNARVTVFEQPSDAVRPEMKAESENTIESAIELPQPSLGSYPSLYTVSTIVCVILAIAAAVIIIGLIFQSGFRAALGMGILHSGSASLIAR